MILSTLQNCYQSLPTESGQRIAFSRIIEVLNGLKRGTIVINEIKLSVVSDEKTFLVEGGINAYNLGIT